MNNELSSLLLQILGLLIVGLFAWHIKKKLHALSFAIIFLFIISYVVQVIMPGEGPVAFIVVLALPIYGVVVVWICVRLSSKKTNDSIKTNDSHIYISTTRYSTLIKRICEEYNENIEIYIDGSRYTGEEIPKMLEWWCKNKTIMATIDFTLSRNGVDLFGFHDSPEEFWAVMSERLFVEQLAKEKIIRFKI